MVNIYVDMGPIWGDTEPRHVYMDHRQVELDQKHADKDTSLIDMKHIMVHREDIWIYMDLER